MILELKMALLAEEGSQSHLWWAWRDVLGVVDCSDMPEWTHIQLTAGAFYGFTAHNVAGNVKGESRAPTTRMSRFLLTVMCVSTGSLSTRLYTDLHPSPQTEVSKMYMDTRWSRWNNLWFFSHRSFSIAQVPWTTSQTGTITSLAQECSFPRGQLIHPAHLHCLMLYGGPWEPLSSLLGERVLEPALFSAFWNTWRVFYSLMKICAQGSYGLWSCVEWVMSSTVLACWLSSWRVRENFSQVFFWNWIALFNKREKKKFSFWWKKCKKFQELANKKIILSSVSHWRRLSKYNLSPWSLCNLQTS